MNPRGKPESGGLVRGGRVEAQCAARQAGYFVGTIVGTVTINLFYIYISTFNVR
jgi:hypothetical protein